MFSTLIRYIRCPIWGQPYLIIGFTWFHHMFMAAKSSCHALNGLFHRCEILWAETTTGLNLCVFDRFRASINVISLECDLARMSSSVESDRFGFRGRFLSLTKSCFTFLQRRYEDVSFVVADVVRRRPPSPRVLASFGTSNPGLKEDIATNLMIPSGNLT